MGSMGSRTLDNGSGIKRDSLKLGTTAKVFDGKAPAGSGFEKHGANDIQIRTKSDGDKDILFQFKLTKDNKMSIRAWDPNVPSKAVVQVTSSSPSLSDVPASQKAAAGKIRDMMNRSKSGITEAALPSIAQELKRKKVQQGGNQ